MCGIAGWIGPDRGWEAERFREGLARRGPDGSGVWQGERATLVHTRLAILDLSEAGAQPMVMETAKTLKSETLKSREGQGACVLVFNGEIYNYQELRADLERDGEAFASDSDTEVLLRWVSLHGTAALSELAGMFAFCFWNEGEGEALLARDAFGIKPLYYRVDGDTLAFASEAGVLQRPGDSCDACALRDFFLWGSVQEPATLNAAIRQLPAGHYLRWKNGQAEVARWNQPLTRVSKPSPKQESTSSALPFHEITRLALLESMQRHLVSDVPVGIFLSGGIDSTVVLALAREILGPQADIRTFSIGFDDPAYDESALARRTAEHFNAQHTEWRMTAEEGAAEIPEFLEAMDQPSIDGFNTWCVSRFARREGIKVVLSGLGGDELFAGYGSFERVPSFYHFHYRMGALRRVIARLLEMTPKGARWRRFAAFLRGEGGWLHAYHVQRGIFSPDEARELASVLGETPQPFTWQHADLSEGDRNKVSLLELTRYMRNQLLRDSDLYASAHGVELRVPFVDDRLIGQLFTIPEGVRLQQGKKLLLEAIPEVPEWIRNRPKRGFQFPFQRWLEADFGAFLADASRAAPFQFRSWYQMWAFAVARHCLHSIQKS